MSDPIRAEQQRAEREAKLDNLFRPPQEVCAIHDIRWLIEGLLPMGCLAILAGRPKSGKTCLATAMALSVATGVPFAGRSTHQTGVLWIAAEESEIERIEILRQSPLYDPATPLYTCHAHLPIDQPETIELILEALSFRQARLIVVDPLLASITGRSLENSWNARRTLQPLKQLCNETHTTAVVLHHQKTWFGNGPRENVADNDQLAATASLNMLLSSRPRYDGRREEDGIVREITLALNGRGSWANRTYFIASGGPLDYRPSESQKKRTPDAISYSERAVLKALLEKPLDSAAIIVNSQIHEGTARNVITSLRRRGLIQVDSRSEGIRYYAMTEKGREFVNS